MPATRAELEAAAYAVADLYRSGHFRDLRGGVWRETWKALLLELERRCPGFSEDQYAKALNDGFTASR